MEERKPPVPHQEHEEEEEEELAEAMVDQNFEEGMEDEEGDAGSTEASVSGALEVSAYLRTCERRALKATVALGDAGADAAGSAPDCTDATSHCAGSGRGGAGGLQHTTSAIKHVQHDELLQVVAALVRACVWGGEVTRR